jgi:uncharacterized membrane protein YjfL (UPF0719 family)
VLDLTAIDVQSGVVAVAKVALFLGFVVALWHLVNALTRTFDDHDELFVNGNWAYFVQRAGLVGGQAIAMAGALDLGEAGWVDLAWFAGAGLWVLVVLLVAHPLIERAMRLAPATEHAEVSAAGSATDTAPSGFDAGTDRLRRINLGASLVKAGFLVSFGLVLNATFAGRAPDLSTGLISTVVFAALGLGVLVLTYRLHDLVTPIRLRKRVRDGNLTASVEAAGALVALGIVVRNAIAGDFRGWATSLAGFAIAVVLTLVALYVFRWLIDKVILTGVTLRSVHADDRTVAAALTAVLLVVVALPASDALSSLLA